MYIRRHYVLSGYEKAYKISRRESNHHDKITKGYVEVPPDLVIEVDTDFEVEDISPMDAVYLKTQQLLDFGTQKVIWIFTNSQKVLVAKPNQPWLTLSWAEDIELMPGTTFNIAAYLAREGIFKPES